MCTIEQAEIEKLPLMKVDVVAALLKLHRI